MKSHSIPVKNRSGIQCPRCKLVAEAREHIFIGPKQLSQPFYYRRWFTCRNKACPTTLIMRDEFKVYPYVPNRPKPKHKDVQEKIDKFASYKANLADFFEKEKFVRSI